MSRFKLPPYIGLSRSHDDISAVHSVEPGNEPIQIGGVADELEPNPEHLPVQFIPRLQELSGIGQDLIASLDPQQHWPLRLLLTSALSYINACLAEARREAI